MSEEIRGMLVVKAGNGKGFKIEGTDGWFNATDKAKPFLEKIEKGTEVIVTYEQKGIARNAVVIKKASGNTATKKETTNSDVTKPSGTPVCEDCGCELKNDKYAKCWTCNQKSPKKYTKKEFKSNYGSPEDINGKEVGCAANCASAIIAGRTEEPDALLELFRILCNGILEHIRTLK